ncbi:MAG: hypothetical protein KJZ78_03850 [Bryobacteraceae bacterium]|nr:hypothetical protein [Bryobacteraceae bacterium]
MRNFFEIANFLIERPALTGAVVWGVLYAVRRSKRHKLSEKEREHALQVHSEQRSYAEKMYDPLQETETGAKPR